MAVPEQPHLLRHLQRPAGHRGNGPRGGHVLPGGRGPRHPLLLRGSHAGVSDGSRGGHGLRVHAQERREPDPVQPPAHRPRHPRGACAEDHQPDSDHLGQLSADVQPGYQPPQPGPPRPGGLSPGVRHGGVRPGGDQRRGRVLRLRPGAHQRRLHLRLRPHQAQRPHPGRGSGRHRGLRPAPGRVRHPDRVRGYRQHPGLSVHRGPAPGAGAAGQRPGGDPPPLSKPTAAA